MKFNTRCLVLAALVALSGSLARAGFFDSLKSALTTTNALVTNAVAGANATASVPPTNATASFLSGLTTGSAVATALPASQVADGLKAALGKGVSNAVSMLGHDNGFLTNVAVRIPVPAQLQKVESALRLAGQGQMVDDFIGSMNHAAEQAVPVAAGLFGDSIKQMSIADAQAILAGPDDAATQYFRRTTQTNLYAKFYPIVQKATDSVGVTASYKAMMSKFASVNTVSSLFGRRAPVAPGLTDVDAYVTDGAMNGLFTMVAAEEKNIRTNPVARTTALLQQVFGSVTAK